MACSVKVIGGCAIGTGILGLIVLILGIIVATSSIPTSNCGGQDSSMGNSAIGISQSEQDSIDAALRLIGLPLIAGGIVCLIGGAIGAFGGCTNNNCGVCCEAALNGVGGGLMLVGLMSALFFSAVFGSVCDDFKCDLTSSQCSHSLCTRYDDVCCKNCDSIFADVSCKESIDWTCKMGRMKLVAALFAAAGMAVAIVTSCCGCGYSCCCPESFIEKTQVTPLVAESSGNVVVVGAAVGTPVGTPVAAKA